MKKNFLRVMLSKKIWLTCFSLMLTGVLVGGGIMYTGADFQDRIIGGGKVGIGDFVMAIYDGKTTTDPLIGVSNVDSGLVVQNVIGLSGLAPGNKVVGNYTIESKGETPLASYLTIVTSSSGITANLNDVMNVKVSVDGTVVKTVTGISTSPGALENIKIKDLTTKGAISVVNVEFQMQDNILTEAEWEAQGGNLTAGDNKYKKGVFDVLLNFNGQQVTKDITFDTKGNVVI